MVGTFLRAFAGKCSYVDITLRLCTYFISYKNLSLKEQELSHDSIARLNCALPITKKISVIR